MRSLRDWKAAKVVFHGLTGIALSRSVQCHVVEKESSTCEEAKRLKAAAAEALSAVKSSMEDQILGKR